LAQHGISLRRDVVSDPHRGLMSSLGLRPPRQTDATARLRTALNNLDHSISTRH